MTAPPLTLDDVRRESRPDLFPVAALDGCRTALAIFSAAFYGRQDVIHLWDAGLDVIAVDTDVKKLRLMQSLYSSEPHPLAVRVVDAGEFMTRAFSVEKSWDVVTFDPWTQTIAKLWAGLPHFSILAARVLIVGATAVEVAEARSLEGFSGPVFLKRSDHAGGIFWAVFKRRDK